MALTRRARRRRRSSLVKTNPVPFEPWPFLRLTVCLAGPSRYLASVAMLNICGLDEVLEKYGPSLSH
jgi:hypothetical protein